MTGSIIPFPLGHGNHGNGDLHGTVHGMGDSAEGFYVSHESRSGNSWGAMFGPYDTGQEAITAAYALNRDDYDNGCEVYVCDAAGQHAASNANPSALLGDW
jgi:hypothetical protein